MRVLLTGAAGFVGRVALDLLSERYEVTAFDIRAVEGYEGGIVGDVLDYSAVSAAVKGHDAVVNMIMAPNPSYGGMVPVLLSMLAGYTISSRLRANTVSSASCTLRAGLYTRAIHRRRPPFCTATCIRSKRRGPMRYRRFCRRSWRATSTSSTVCRSRRCAPGALSIPSAW